MLRHDVVGCRLSQGSRPFIPVWRFKKKGKKEPCEATTEIECREMGCSVAKSMARRSNLSGPRREAQTAAEARIDKRAAI